MNILEFLDRIGERRIARWHIRAPRPMDTKQFVAVAFFAGYYVMVWSLRRGPPLAAGNEKLVGDAMLVLGPVIGLIAQAIFRSDAKDELATQNTGEFARAATAQANATIAAAATTPSDSSANLAADKVVEGAQEAADKIRVETTVSPTAPAHTGGPGNVPDPD